MDNSKKIGSVLINSAAVIIAAYSLYHIFIFLRLLFNSTRGGALDSSAAWVVLAAPVSILFYAVGVFLAWGLYKRWNKARIAAAVLVALWEFQGAYGFLVLVIFARGQFSMGWLLQFTVMTVITVVVLYFLCFNQPIVSQFRILVPINTAAAQSQNNSFTAAVPTQFAVKPASPGLGKLAARIGKYLLILIGVLVGLVILFLGGAAVLGAIQGFSAGFQGAV